jgi:hypothetical protein
VFNVSLAYLAWADTRLELPRHGDDLVVHLEAPLNSDYGVVNIGKVWVTAARDRETVTV